ncbi:zinc transporter ZIP10-like [Stylophora pistillata]|uniref:Zinc transporter ZIP10 n=1 Tax=Stylophora pistillata TaxID=50429 RepID=A0A2B4S6Y2_STYPI|nr:zinc transporter ZIP10-like [Stylophora pistillata]XP_022792903.1 zinc transporter ZIP10-like [Stylophora pistillata]PFX24235.1 Zinc transporter ZIP10 [Stylophora pistillata]
MAICDLHFSRLFYFMMAFSMLSTATIAGQIINRNDSLSSSSNKNDFLNRTVVLNDASEHFLDLIFHEYTDNLTEKISIARFKDLLNVLNLGEVVSTKETSMQLPKGTSHGHGGQNSQSHNGESGEASRLRNMRRRRSEHHSKGGRGQLQLNSKTTQILMRSSRRERRHSKERSHSNKGHTECLTGHELLHIHDVNDKEGLGEEDFVRICPALIQQLQDKACIIDNLEGNDMGEDSAKMLHVWGYGFLSITVISLTSLLAIAVIPLMRHSIYKKIMSFLVALAVGTLSGDALLHLIPHAFVSSHGNEEGHKMNIYKSCVIMAGIYVFFTVECMLKARMARKKRSHGNLHVCDDVTTPEKMKKQAAKYQEMVGSRLAGIQRSISCEGAHFPKASGDISGGCKTTSYEMVHLESGKEERGSTSSESSQEKVPLWEPRGHGHHCQQRDSVQERGRHSFSDSHLIAALQGKSCIHPNIYSHNNFSASGTDSHDPTHHNINQIRSHQNDQYSHQVPTESNTIATETTSDAGDGGYGAENGHNNHHHHSHNIDKNTSIATVAWMVIVGDGFHNFSDGLAVGVAFSASLTNGLTTAIAVFCHELPHELGDFAVLLKSGLTFRQALAYNFASAIISYIGLILGIIIGDMQSAHTWVLALTAGMFLYISLVDMLPELSNYINEGGGLPVVFSQNLGILTGVSIMLTIALYES